MPDHGGSQIESLPEGAVCWALDRVTAPTDVAPLLHRLLQQCVIARDLDSAFYIRQNNRHLSVVTMGGDVITSDGIAQSGETSGAGTSVLQRKAQIEELEHAEHLQREEVTALESRVSEFTASVESLGALAESLREETQAAQMALAGLEGQQSMLQRDLREMEGKRETLEWERTNLAEGLQTSDKKSSNLQDEITRLQTSIEESRERMQQLQAESEELRYQEDQLTAALNELKVTAATNRQRRENLERERRPMSARVQELGELIAQRRVDIETYTTRSTALQSESEELLGGIETLRGEAADVETRAAAVVESRTALMSALHELEAELREARRELSRLQETRAQQEIAQSQVTMRMEHLSEHMQQRYQIAIAEFIPDSYAFHCAVREQKKRSKQPVIETAEPVEDSTPQETGEPVEVEEIIASKPAHEEVDWAFVEAMVKEMSEKLDSMGPINMDAIQEYDELEERSKFLDEQYADLTNSKAELLDTISKINVTTRQLFADTFEQVRVNFQEMFTELFGAGAKANLLLASGEDPLECGIEIIAKPPGKQLQSISLLSGGEKTMTAVALLFSIYMVKPSPFCVLDEMDAPLDESNINRFIKILDRFVAQSQFVVITHNKRTIAKADVLYGVTMEEHGVSKLVGVKLTKREDATQSEDFAAEPANEEPPSIAESFGKSNKLHSEVNEVSEV